MREAVFLAALAAAGCSFVLDKNTVQCTTNADCERFEDHPVCSAEQVCVASGLGPHGCFFGEPTVTEEFNNACSTAQCQPFDNCERLGLCDGQALPPLVPKP